MPIARNPRWGFRPTRSDNLAPTVTGVSLLSGRIAGGDAITLTGTNFIVDAVGGGVAVYFGTLVATSVVVVDRQTITCAVPASADVGLTDITVTTYGGSLSGTGFGLFTYYTATIVTATPNHGPIAGSTSVLLEGFNFDTGTQYTVYFGGVAATGVIIIDAQHIRCTSPAHATGFVDITLRGPLEEFDPAIFDPAIFEVTPLTPALVATFRNGFQFTLLTRGSDIRRQPGIVIRDVLGRQPNTCHFLVDGSSNVPLVGEKIEIDDSQDGNRRLFAGTVQSVTQVYEGLNTQLAFDVQCIDFTWLFNRRRPFGSYNQMSASDVVKDLVSKYAPGYTTAHVQTNLAKVTVTLDGSDDLITVLSNIAQAIGGGHWYVDYDQDVHFFHLTPVDFVVPTEFLPPTISLPVLSAVGSSGTYRYTPGYYFVRTTFVYSDGTESAFGPISNVLFLDGQSRINVSAIPIGTNIGTVTCIARRVYYNAFVASVWSDVDTQTPIEVVKKYVEISDNVTTSFQSDFGSRNASVATVGDIASSVAVPETLADQHPPGPKTAPYAVANIIYNTAGFTNGGLFQFKVAFVYRDGTVSFPSPASDTAGQKYLVIGTGILGFNLSSVPVGPTLNGNDVVARFIYYSQGRPSDPNFSLLTNNTEVGSTTDLSTQIGYVTPFASDEPDWAWDVSASGIVIIPDNTTIAISFNLGLLGTPKTNDAEDTPLLVGVGNLPYSNGAEAASSVDPIPIWPNPDGPSLEDVTPPDDITNSNPDLLHQDAGQSFEVSTDLSQVRNRVYVIGSGTTASFSALAGARTLQVNEIASMSPNGGRVKIEDPSTNTTQVVRYTGIGGIVGQAYIKLATGLKFRVAQGATVHNFYQADDFDSQAFLGKAELDVNGHPTDGIHEYTIVDGTLKATWQLFMRAHAELELFARPIVQVRYATRDPKSKSGQTVHIDIDNPPCQGDFLIQDVQIDQIHDDSDALLPRYTVTASSVKFELTDLLLQILGAKVNNVSAVGTTVANVSTASQDFPQSLPIVAGALRRWGQSAVQDAGVQAQSVGFNGTQNSTGAQSIVVDAAAIGGVLSVWQRYTPTGANANLCGWTNSQTFLWDLRPTFITRFRTAPTLDSRTAPVLGERVYWIGLAVTAPPAGSETFTNNHVMLLCSTKGSNTRANWEISIGYGGAQSRTSVGFMTMLPNTQYQAMFKYLSATTASVTLHDVTNNNTQSVTVSISGFVGQTFAGYVYGTTQLNQAATSFLDIGSIYTEVD